jgi:phage-related protein
LKDQKVNSIVNTGVPMSFRLRLARHPQRLTTPHALVIEDFLQFARQGKRTCLRAAIEMCADLHQNGMESRYIKHLGGALYELKKRANDGGARVYFFRLDDDFVLVHAECKTENSADRTMLSDMLSVIRANESEEDVLF